MATKTVKTQIGLRRDTEANYELVKDTLIPVKGEVCMVDTNKGLKFKVGDGTSTFAQLDFIEPNTSGAGGTTVEANPELTGDEEKLNSITIDGTNYDIPSGAEAYVEENQTLVINNNGTGGSSNNNLFQRRLDQPSVVWNSETSETDLMSWFAERAEQFYIDQILRVHSNYFHAPVCVAVNRIGNWIGATALSVGKIRKEEDEGILLCIYFNYNGGSVNTDVWSTTGEDYISLSFNDITKVELY